MRLECAENMKTRKYELLNPYLQASHRIYLHRIRDECSVPGFGSYFCPDTMGLRVDKTRVALSAFLGYPFPATAVHTSSLSVKGRAEDDTILQAKLFA